MHIFIPIHFNAPLGGLQLNVMATVKSIISSKNSCTVMCKSGEFANSLKNAGSNVIETDFSNLSKCVSLAQSGGKYDIVHAHPFLSRKVGIMISRLYKIPFIVTFHGMYTESLSKYHSEVDYVITVCDAIKNYISQNVNISPERTLTLPNGVDKNIFYRFSNKNILLEKFNSILTKINFKTTDRLILLVSRLDPDKKFILDVIKETWRRVIETKAFNLKWFIAGDGVLRSEIEKEANKVNQNAGQKIIEFLGWQNDISLSNLYNLCHLTIGSGRSVIESMACGTPAVAIGSKGYVGIINQNTLQKGVYENFGGFGTKHISYKSETMFFDIDRVIYNDVILKEIGELSLCAVDAFFKQDDIDNRLLKLYELCCKLKLKDNIKNVEWVNLNYPKIAFLGKDKLDQYSNNWFFPIESEKFKIDILEEGSITANCNMSLDDKIYISTESTNFGKPPKDIKSYKLDLSEHYEFSVYKKCISGDAKVQFWIIEYNDESKVSHYNIWIENGFNKIELTSSAESKSFKLAFRFSGKGIIKLDQVRIRKIKVNNGKVQPELKRKTDSLSFNEYTGENLSFIFGAPRSGTTWVLKLLNEHPDIIAATERNLDSKKNNNETYETNIFNSNRHFTDNQIKWKFFLLSKNNKNKVVVEKTPIHLFYSDRIKRIFPNAVFILIERDGRDVVTSILNVGRDPNAWWKNAPRTIESSTKLWKKYAEAGLHCSIKYNPIIIRYEEILNNTNNVLMQLLKKLELSTTSISSQVNSCKNGKNISIRGVYREGKTGGWKKEFTEKDIIIFKKIAGETLIRMGYEDDENWNL